MSLVSEIVRRVGASSSGSIRAFFHYVAKVEMAKKQLHIMHMEARMGETAVDTNLSIC